VEVPACRVLALDINETIADLASLTARLEEVGAPDHLLPTWFASTLRDGFALTSAGGYADFATVARAALRELLAHVASLNGDPDEAADHVLDALAELSLHDDVRPGLERLHEAGIRIVTLTNGSLYTTRRLLERGGVASYIEQWLSVEEGRRWKPAPEPYRMAGARCGVALEQVMLVAAHPWDVDGAKRAGLSAAWINRNEARYPQYLEQPDLSLSDFEALADALG
jgi:2-haloacid dehalogenase